MGKFDFQTLDDVDTRGKKVFLRVDINVPLDPSTHEILDDTRIRATQPTLEELADAAVVLGSHQSRPGKDDFTSLEPHADLLSRYCSREVLFVEDVLGPHARQAISKLRPGQVLVLDNLRFCAEENIDDKPEKLVKSHFVRRLAPMFDCYVNDAFAAAHRSQASLVGLSEALPSAAGRLMEKELAAVSTLLESPRRPSVYVLGGAKVEDKLRVIEHILGRNKADKILLGGVAAKLFLAAQGKKALGEEEREITRIQEFLDKAKELVKKHAQQLEVPLDFGYEEKGKRVDLSIDSSPAKGSALDIGARTVKEYSDIVRGAATVVANGPLGVFERNGFDIGTKSILESMAESSAYTVIGGGHLVGLAAIHGIEDRFSHVSTAGGAMLSLLAGQTLPAVDALVRAAKRASSSNPYNP